MIIVHSHFFRLRQHEKEPSIRSLSSHHNCVCRWGFERHYQARFKVFRLLVVRFTFLFLSSGVGFQKIFFLTGRCPAASALGSYSLAGASQHSIAEMVVPWFSKFDFAKEESALFSVELLDGGKKLSTWGELTTQHVLPFAQFQADYRQRYPPPLTLDCFKNST